MPDKELLADMILGKLVSIKSRMYRTSSGHWIGYVGPGTGKITSKEFVVEMDEVINMVDGYDRA